MHITILSTFAFYKTNTKNFNVFLLLFFIFFKHLKMILPEDLSKQKNQGLNGFLEINSSPICSAVQYGLKRY